MGDWRHALLSNIRRWIREAEPQAVEERKWVKPSNPDGVPVWSRSGIICTGEIYRNHVKVTFAQGASLRDPSHLFNASLDGKVRRAINIHEGEELDETAFKDLIRQAAESNSLRLRS